MGCAGWQIAHLARPCKPCHPGCLTLSPFSHPPAAASSLRARSPPCFQEELLRLLPSLVPVNPSPSLLTPSPLSIISLGAVTATLPAAYFGMNLSSGLEELSGVFWPVVQVSGLDCLHEHASLLNL